MSYTHALAERRRAVTACRAAGRSLNAAVDDMLEVYQARPLPTLAGAAGIGFVLAQLEVGKGLIRTGMRIAAGPAWGILRQYLRVP